MYNTENTQDSVELEVPTSWVELTLSKVENALIKGAGNLSHKIHAGLTGEEREQADYIRALAEEQLFPKEEAETNESLADFTVGLYILLGKIAQLRGELADMCTSNVVDKNTVWEYYLSVREKAYRPMNITIESGENIPMDPISMAEVALLWLARNSSKYKNQPLDCVFGHNTDTFDPRLPTNSYRAAVRLNNGNYKIIQINPDLIRDKEQLNITNPNLFLVENEEVPNPQNVQLVVDNRAISPGYGFEVNLQVDSAPLGLASTNEGLITLNVDHLFMDGVATVELAWYLAKYTKSCNTNTKLQPETTGTHYRPVLLLEDLAPTLNKLSTTQMISAYARTMLDPRIGFSECDTVLIPQIEAKNEQGIPNQNQRMQPTALKLRDLAQAHMPNSPAKQQLKGSRTDMNSSGLYHALKVANDPRIPKVVQSTLVKVAHKIPVIGPIGRALNGVGLISTPALPIIEESENCFYGQPQRNGENCLMMGNTIVSQAEVAFNITAMPNEAGVISYGLAGTPDVVTQGDLVLFARILEQNAASLLCEVNRN